MPDDVVVKKTVEKPNKLFIPQNQLRFVTATSLFDGHDASINIMRRMLQAAGVEVIHMGHNRSVDEISTAAVQEDVHAVAISSYQGGHVEYFKFLADSLHQKGRGDVKIFGGGGGVIAASEIAELQSYGITRIFSPQDGQRLGLEGMISEMVELADYNLIHKTSFEPNKISSGDQLSLAQFITRLENNALNKQDSIKLETGAAKQKSALVLGITGTGGAGKSSVTDELINRFRQYSGQTSIAVLAIDPTRRKTQGALLGDRIRMNSIDDPNIYMRSIATRGAKQEIPGCLGSVIDACKVAGFKIVIIETPGIGQGDSGITDYSDISLYVMTPEFGAQSQLEKIDMLDFADVVAINKMDRKGGADALRDVRKQVLRNRKAFNLSPVEMPVYGCKASVFADAGITSLYAGIVEQFKKRGVSLDIIMPSYVTENSENSDAIISPERTRYLSEITETVRTYLQEIDSQAVIARERQQLVSTKKMLNEAGDSSATLNKLIDERNSNLNSYSKEQLKTWPEVVERYSNNELLIDTGKTQVNTVLKRETLSGNKISRVALPRFEDDGEILKYLLKENLPGHFPFTSGVFPFKRDNEDPIRMFAGEGDAFRTNARFKLLSKGLKAKRLSTAFDSVTLYGFDPSERPDVYGKIGNSGVSIATLDDMKVLFSDFNLCDPDTSVSMTINGPAPAILAMFLNTAIEQQVDIFNRENNREASESEYKEIESWVLKNVRGTVQADILKEDQGQNTCIFSTEFAIKMMADIQEYFIWHQIRKFYSVSISGYHIAEAGANPISQLAFTLANGFTFVEAYLARGMNIDDFAPNFSFFFSNGMDPEYTVLGRVARRIWAVAIRFKYGGNARSQKLKYHTQTSGRSLHAQEMSFNDIRTTLQALVATYDNTNSLHTNAFDEAVTTPTDNSVRRAMAIQMIINKEWGLAKNENPNQGSYIIEELTDLVEEAVLQEFMKISERGGVLGAMETGYQRSKIQEESLHYENLKHSGDHPIVGVNTFLNEESVNVAVEELQRSSDGEKKKQLKRLQKFKFQHEGNSACMLESLKISAIKGENTFAVLMNAVKVCSLGQITKALFEAGGQYRRNM